MFLKFLSESCTRSLFLKNLRSPYPWVTLGCHPWYPGASRHGRGPMFCDATTHPGQETTVYFHSNGSIFLFFFSRAEQRIQQRCFRLHVRIGVVREQHASDERSCLRDHCTSQCCRRKSEPAEMVRLFTSKSASCSFMYRLPAYR